MGGVVIKNSMIALHPRVYYKELMERSSYPYRLGLQFKIMNVSGKFIFLRSICMQKTFLDISVSTHT